MNKIIEKIKEFFYRLKKDKKVLLVENTSNNSKNNLNEFKESLDARDEQKIIDLQKKYESGEIADKELSPFQVLDLIDLYKKQISKLDIEISLKQSKLNKV